ncbi:hypothetical protein CXB51_017233 [Gossypium anomalum]|uniref:Aminotransferase-like plant mobile domain-containing protein n=1 Tax=Gossypium anomalum TaxID=47600 RepID=A0A8J5YXE9_9ROSI|nr:hypothetical protein CXB51_017233 [Gossypium anomalum]
MPAKRVPGGAFFATSAKRFHSVDRVLQCYICNMSGPPSPEVETGDAHIPSSIRRVYYHFGGRPVTIRLSVDGAALTGFVQSADWGALCSDLLGAILDNIYGGWIEMSCLRDTFPEPGNDSTEVERIRYARVYILEMIGGYLVPDLSRNLVHLRWLLKLVDFRAAGELSWGSVMLATLYREMCGVTPPNKAKIGGCLSVLQSWARFCFPFLRPRMNHPYTFPLITRWNHPASYVRIPTALEDIWLLLDQRSEVQEDPIIRAVILEEFFQNPNIWHVKVPLVNSAIVKMHQMDRVLRQFRFRQPILEEPENPWQAMFAVGRAEILANPCGKGTTVPFKSKEKG